MVAASAIVLIGSGAKSLAIYAMGFIVLFVLTGVGNGSTYKMIPAIFRGKGWRQSRGAVTSVPS